MAIGVVLLGILTIVILAVTLASNGTGHNNKPPVLPERLNSNQCPADFGHRPVLLVSLDGFRPDYLKRGLTPTIQMLVKGGVSAPYMAASYPTVTFPNHYTIVTGMYPGSHGIIDNYMYDPVFNKTFSLGGTEKNNGTWWGGEPIWNTMTKQGKKSATYFWPGSDADIQGTHPTYWFPYSVGDPFEDRVQKVLEWLSLPADDRPHWIALYFNEPDHEGHNMGPDSPEVDKQLVRVDTQIANLVAGIVERNLVHCVNLILVADHGMAQAGADKNIQLTNIYPKLNDVAEKVIHGATSRIKTYNESQEAVLDLQRLLSCNRKELRVFMREDLPKRLHYSTHRRIEPLIIDLDPGFYTLNSKENSSKTRTSLKGHHGYDYYFPEMNQGVEVEAFQNVELYNLMCFLTNVTPAHNNGTWGALHHLLSILPPPLKYTPQQVKPPTLSYSKDATKSRDFTISCKRDLIPSTAWHSALALTAEQQKEAETRHAPWGVPFSIWSASSRLALLHHHTHLSVNEIPLHIEPASWSSDPRLQPRDSPPCTFNHTNNLTMAPLFPYRYVGDGGSNLTSLRQVPYMITNALVMSEQLMHRWNYLLWNLFPSWYKKYGVLNVVSGPVVPAIPTDIFAVVTRCLDPVTSLDQCGHLRVDAQAFIFPQLLPSINCLTDRRFTQMYSAKVRDVEVATGLTFYSRLTHYSRLGVILRINPDLWE
ncbi:Ectonucleotide pyrophosphatase/phosphodiesterase family member 1-like [Homarus americanus]|uniref:Ectonucleotide pyrophosphatase/phosphodiesterase family member 1-like n=1 Tax=Homarus americanus TaxID=6706 RepID=A0A8J5J665_HOMAM|nr:Ectonucleotide pyrophosphatase/phosphodiesterase family member 1-like [Homarus americanus]